MWPVTYVGPPYNSGASPDVLQGIDFASFNE
jgi:hypothetical protein